MKYWIVVFLALFRSNWKLIIPLSVTLSTEMLYAAPQTSASTPSSQAPTFSSLTSTPSLLPPISYTPHTTTSYTSAYNESSSSTTFPRPVLDYQIAEKGSIPYSLQSSLEQEDDILINVDEYPEILEQLEIGVNPPEHTPSFITNLRLVAFGGETEITLGFAANPRPGFITALNGMTLNTVYLSNAACSTRCQPNQAGVIEEFPLLNWIPRIARAQSSVTDSSGICGEVSVAHALVARTMVHPDWTGVIDGDYWDDGYIDLVWKQAGSNVKGTSTENRQKALKADWNSRWYNITSNDTHPSSGLVMGFGATTVQSWCEALQKAVHDKSNACILSLNGGGPKRNLGHVMYITSVKWDTDLCSIDVVDTGRQGSPTGRNVPKDPGSQTWTISGDPDAQKIENTRGFASRFWNSKKYNNVGAQCTYEKRTWYATTPEGKGTVWP